MVPRVTSKGSSFKGAGAYFLHDLGKSKTSERVAFTHTVNMLTDDPEKAIKVMAWTATHAQELKQIGGQKLTGRKAEHPVYNFVLAWAPDQKPEPSHMIEQGLKSLEVLGLSEHEALFVAHSDTDHMHLHVIANRVHPVTGLMAKMSKDQLHLSRFAQAYEEQGGKIYCPERVINNRARDRGQRVRAKAEERHANTPEYKERRAARVAAQRKAGKLAHEKLRAEGRRAEAARDMRASFDQASAHDDRRYRAREIERPPEREAKQAQAAWADERTAQRQAEHDRKASAQRAFIDSKRAERWADYEAKRWQALNDKQTERREGLHDIQASVRARFETRLARKYEQAEGALDRRHAAVVDQLGKWSVRGLVGRLSARRADLTAQLELCQRARIILENQKTQERQELVAHQAGQREVQHQRQHAERERLAASLQKTKAEQDLAFEAREQERLTGKAARKGVVEGRLRQQFKGTVAIPAGPLSEREKVHVRPPGEGPLTPYDRMRAASRRQPLADDRSGKKLPVRDKDKNHGPS